MSDATARTRLIGLHAKQIAELEAEVDRLKLGKRPRYSRTWERILVLLVTGAIAVGQSWVSAHLREARADDDIAAAVTVAERDVAVLRADSLYDTAEALFIAGDAEGCTFTEVE